MKRTSLYLLLVALALLKPALAAPTAEQDLLQKELQYQPQDASADDYMIGLARAGGLNLLADVTNVTTDSRVAPYPGTPTSVAGLQGKYADKWNSTLLNLIVDFTRQKELTHSLHEGRTLLLWSQPDVIEIGRLIAASEKANPVLKPPGERAMRRLLMQYLAEKYPQQENAPEAAIEVPISSLPAELREGILKETRAVYLGRIASRNSSASFSSRRGEEAESTESEEVRLEASPAAWFDESFWSKATLRIGKGQIGIAGQGATYFPQLLVGGFVDSDGDGQLEALSTLVGRLDNHVLASIAQPEERVQKTDRTIQPNLLNLTSTAPTAIVTASAQLREPIAKLPGLDAADLERDTSLTARVSLELKSQPLSVLLTELEKQSGARFAAGEGVAANQTKITARIAETPLAEVMQDLARLGAMEWARAGEKSFVLQSGNYSELERSMLPLGNRSFFRIHRGMSSSIEEIKQQENEFAMAIVDQVGAENLRSPDGVLVSSLPTEMQEHLRQYVLERISPSLMTDFAKEEVLSQELYLHRGVTPREIKLAPSASSSFLSKWQEPQPEITVRTKDGTQVAQIYNTFNFALPIRKPLNAQ